MCLSEYVIPSFPVHFFFLSLSLSCMLFLVPLHVHASEFFSRKHTKNYSLFVCLAHQIRKPEKESALNFGQSAVSSSNKTVALCVPNFLLLKIVCRLDSWFSEATLNIFICVCVVCIESHECHRLTAHSLIHIAIAFHVSNWNTSTELWIRKNKQETKQPNQQNQP